MNPKSIQKAATRQAMLEALKIELSQGARLTVEGIAGRAGVNKALVYRYFGGLHGLIGTFAESDEFMASAEELRSLCSPDLQSLPTRERFAQCIQAYVKTLQRRPASVQILLRLHAMDVQTLDAIAEGRTRAMNEIREAFGPNVADAGFDIDLAFNLLVSGVCQLLGSSRESWTKDRVALELLSKRIADTVGGMLLPPMPLKA